MHPRDFMRDYYDFDFPYPGGERFKEEVTFATTVKDLMDRVEDIILDANSKKVNIDIFIDILTD